ncbi:MAG: hypothetical protein H0V97_03505 [Actinobacteria bacterium]|nr:hypothetical protein [Actinomycetota bacterium]
MGWDLFGEAGRGLDPNPLGTTGRLVAQALVVLAGGLVGAWVVSRRTGAGQKTPSLVALGVLLTAGAFAITAP